MNSGHRAESLAGAEDKKTGFIHPSAIQRAALEALTFLNSPGFPGDGAMLVFPHTRIKTEDEGCIFVLKDFLNGSLGLDSNKLRCQLR